MNCFNHPLGDAVGICKNCSRGLCVECVVDQGFGLACKGRCEGEVKSIWQIIQKNKKVYQRTSAVYLRAALLYGLMGLLFLLFPYFFQGSTREQRYLFSGIGGLFLLGTVLNLFNASRIKKND